MSNLLSNLCGRVGRASEFDEWFSRSCRIIRREVPCDSVTFAELHVNVERPFANAIIDLPDFDSKSLLPAFIETYQQHPISPETILDRIDSRVWFTSDFVSQPKLHETDLYKRVFGELEIEYQARLVLRIGANVIFGMGVNRRQKPFGEGDRDALTRLQDCLTHSYRMLRIHRNLQQRSDLLVNVQGRILAGNPRALELLAEFFHADFKRHSRVPEAVVAWLKEHLRFENVPESAVPPENPYTKRLGNRTLQIYAGESTVPGQFILAIRVATKLSYEASIGRLIHRSALERRKLSPKEATVLYWWSHGKSAKEIASTTGLTSTRGVLKGTKSIEKAIERIYDKLDLHGRFEVTRLAHHWLEQKSGEKAP